MRSLLWRILWRIFAFILSALIAAVLASLFSTQFVIAGLAKAGGNVGMGERLSMTIYDIINMGPMYAIFIFLGLLVAFLVAGLLAHLAKGRRTLIYIVAGGMCFIVMLYLMKAVFFGVPIIGGARSVLGLAFQALAGGIAGYVFARLTRRAS